MKVSWWTIPLVVIGHLNQSLAELILVPLTVAIALSVLETTAALGRSGTVCNSTDDMRERFGAYV